MASSDILLYYVRLNATLIPYRVHRHRLKVYLVHHKDHVLVSELEPPTAATGSLPINNTRLTSSLIALLFWYRLWWRTPSEIHLASGKY